MSDTDFVPLTGGCACSAVRYKLTASPLIIHCCHCYWCQRETGSAFVFNALIESQYCELAELNNDSVFPAPISTPSESGDGQTIVRCTKCQVALWSHYGIPTLAFIRAGTLDPESKARFWKKVEDKEWDMVHIFTTSKVPWVVIPDGARSFEEYYDNRIVWRKESLERREKYWPEVLEYRNKHKENAAQQEADSSK
jgi:hypothetical protein